MAGMWERCQTAEEDSFPPTLSKKFQMTTWKTRTGMIFILFSLSPISEDDEDLDVGVGG